MVTPARGLGTATVTFRSSIMARSPPLSHWGLVVTVSVASGRGRARRAGAGPGRDRAGVTVTAAVTAGVPA